MTTTLRALLERVEAGAEFSPCRRYRYRLWRIWDRTKPTLAFLMLNPSTADETVNDPTIERCERRARALGFGGLEVANIFALRSTDPTALYSADDPIGPDNDMAIGTVAEQAGMVICGWGKHGAFRKRGQAVIEWLYGRGIVPHALKINGDGSPQHPLYIGYAVQPQPIAQQEPSR